MLKGGIAINIRSEVRELRDRLIHYRRLAEHYRTTVIPLRERIVELTEREYSYMLVGAFDLHHTMNPMGHNVPNLLDVSQKGLEGRIKALLPGYMAMGETGMAEHAEHIPHMKGPANTLPMMSGKGPYGNIERGGDVHGRQGEG